MGLYGALVVRPAGLPGQAYADPATAFDDEALVVLERDRPGAERQRDARGRSTCAPSPRSASSSTARRTRARPRRSRRPSGNTLLLRYVNAGIQHHSHRRPGPAPGGARRGRQRAAVPADDGRRDRRPGPVGRRPRDDAGDDRDLHEVRRSTTPPWLLNNSSASAASAACSRSSTRPGHRRRRDTVGPITSGVTLTETTPGIVHAHGHGGRQRHRRVDIAAAEYRIDSTSATPTAMTAVDLGIRRRGLGSASRSPPARSTRTSWTRHAHDLRPRPGRRAPATGAPSLHRPSRHRHGPAPDDERARPDPEPGRTAPSPSPSPATGQRRGDRQQQRHGRRVLDRRRAVPTAPARP